MNDRSVKGFELFLPLPISISKVPIIDQVKVPVIDQVKDVRGAILELCKIPKSKKEILEHLSVKASKSSYLRYIKPLIDEKMLEMTIPDKPNSRSQKYQISNN